MSISEPVHMPKREPERDSFAQLTPFEPVAALHRHHPIEFAVSDYL